MYGWGLTGFMDVYLGCGAKIVLNYYFVGLDIREKEITSGKSIEKLKSGW